MAIVKTTKTTVLVIDIEEIVRSAMPDKSSVPLTEAEAVKLYELAAMRIWTLKRSLADKIRRERINNGTA